MSPLFDWFAAPAWSHLVAALLHSLWQGAILAVGLWMGLHFVTRPQTRYRLALVALTATVAASLVTWAVLQTPPAPQTSAVTSVDGQGQPPGAAAAGVANPPSPVDGGAWLSQRPESAPTVSPWASNWSAWLAVLWVAGAAGMLVRAGSQVAGAGRVRRECQPLTAGPVPAMLEDIQKSLGMVRRIRVVVTDRLASPAVVGVLVPTLILPLSLLTALTPEQLRFILLHELAHIRRGDYLVNLFQLLVEALLFFNPAVWWLSRQIRLEREACCDAVAVERSGAPTEYAHTLLRVAEGYGQCGSVAAPAFGGNREPSSLAERIQRLFSPGTRPHLRLTWRAMLGAVLAGGGLLVLSALGTRLTVAALLTPQQRMDRMEKRLAEIGEEAVPTADQARPAKLAFSGRVRTEDGGPLPDRVWICSLLAAWQSTTHSTVGLATKDGTFHDKCRAGLMTLGVEVPGYAPCVLGPLVMQGTHPVTGLEMVLRRGFAVTIQMTDAESGAPLANAAVTAHFSQVTGNFAERKLTTDSQGNAVMPHCANLAVDLTGSAPGFETVRQSFASLTTNETLKLATRRGTATRGLVLDKTSGQPLAGAVIQMLFQQGASESYYDWESHPVVLATSDRDGHFVTTQLRQDSRYRLGVSLPGRESVVLKGVRAGDSNLVARLGPELIVHGRITGNLQAVTNQDGTANVDYTINDQETHIGRSYFVNARTTNGVIYFEFTNRTAWPVDLHVAGFRETRTVDAPVADWLVELTNPPANPMPPSMRDVVVRLKAVSGIPPRGAIKFVVPANPNHQQIEYDNKRVALTNGAARLALPVGAGFSYELDKTTLGYWFESGFTWTNVAAGDGPLVIEVPVIPAGVIAARARNADGSPAGGLTFSILVVKPPPAVNNRNATGYDQGDGFSDNGPRHYVTPPLPLGGEYEIIGWRGNSFCVSDPIKLTEAAPDPEVELQFPPGQDLTGRILGPDGQPVRDAKVDNEAEINDHSFGLKPTFTDANGTFRLTECSQDIAHYTLKVSQSGFASEKVTADFQHLPLTVRLQPGLKLTGRVVEAASGGVIPNAEVRVVPEEAGHWTPVTTRTDANGQYEFNTLGAATYQVFVNGANIGPKNHGQFHMTEFHAGVVTNLELKVSPYPGSQLAVRRAR